MPTENSTWTLRLTPPGAPATTLTGVPQSEFRELLRSLMAGEPVAELIGSERRAA
jgi:hypothetical protein